MDKFKHPSMDQVLGSFLLPGNLSQDRRDRDPSDNIMSSHGQSRSFKASPTMTRIYVLAETCYLLITLGHGVNISSFHVPHCIVQSHPGHDLPMPFSYTTTPDATPLLDIS